MGKLSGKSYCPSNGSEGDWFEHEFCCHCIHEKFWHTQQHGDKQCDIFNRAFLHRKDDPQFPKEWTYDDNDRPTCTAHVPWDWGSSDDEGGLREPPEPPDEPDPNQLVLPFLLDEIEENSVAVKQHQLL